MSSFGKKIAGGAAWMVGMRLIERSIGFVSTLILARLLVPEDFGIVAMAMAVYAFIEVAGQFGFDFALIREREASRSHYDTAWTLGLCYGVFSALALAALAVPTANFFNDARLENVMYAMAAIAFIQSLENVGTIEFRKHFQFKKDFLLVFSKKIIAFTVTVSLAIALESYWALIAGTAASRLSGVVLSYMMHPYRPRVAFCRTKELFRFSKWILTTRLVQYVGSRGPDFMIGRYLDAASLGLYRIAHEISTLPTSELVHPIMRAVFPGYAEIAKDKKALSDAFLSVQGAILLITLPAGIGIVLVAEPLVLVLLGSKWTAAVPLIQVLGLYGAITVFQATNNSVFNALGVPKWGTIILLTEVSILIPSFFLAVKSGFNLNESVWLIVIARILVTPLGILLIGRLLNISTSSRARVTWRPLSAVTVMAITLFFMDKINLSSLNTLQILVLKIILGAIVYTASLLILWQLSGRPKGAEQQILSTLASKIRLGKR